MWAQLVVVVQPRKLSKFDDPDLSGGLKTTLTLKAVSVGTELIFEHQGFPDAIPIEGCYLGWQESLQTFAELVGPETRP